ncbi:hypothetical protein BDV95DRAFT_528341 [Massariosphaeria phaeospora]|uniref:Cytochrome b561 domain-containing protein n=1 Tax=Massariosphaeria phaeospora TaxID=100035 RepID=A0A7C8M1L9_9PLEO|nr:hypothetical protein BDV95DRAFT_528341 [Massariosphaeria phaeospora]
MSNSPLSPPGSSVYSSDSMYVGDGTWDSQRNTFLLPNLQGLNLATTQYNGMGNRFRNMAGYHGVILAHGVLATLTFLFVVPAAILMARFYHRNPRLALRIHIWLQIMTVLLSTAAFILGFQAVGPKRSLTNPHHGIGVALYTLILIQAFGGCIIHRREKGKERYKIPLKLMLHQWLGRAVAILGVVQVALGLTLYGSPKVLFILFAVWVFLLLISYFVLSYMNQPNLGFDDGSTYISERTTNTSRRSHRGHGVGTVAAAGVAGAGLAALRQRSRSRSRRRPNGNRQEVLSSRHSSHLSGSYVEDEKYTTDGRKERTWRDRLLGASAAAGGVFALKSLFGRKKHTPTESGSDVSYSRPMGPSEVTQTDLSRLEEGRAPASPANDRWRRAEEREAAQAAAMAGSPLRQGQRARRSGDSIGSYDSRSSFSDDRHDTRRGESHGLRDGIAKLGVAGFLKHQWTKRTTKEDAHVASVKEHDIREERIARENSQRRKYTGDGAPPRKVRPPSTILSESEISGATPAIARSNIPPPPRSTTNLTHAETIAGPSTGSVLPPPPSDNHGVLSDSGSEVGGGRHHRLRPNGNGAFAAGAAATGASTGSPSRRDGSRRRSSREGSVASPPVSVKVKMHNDGRHVTLRRLGEEEAAAEREARRRDRSRRNRNGSMSSISNLDNDRWRRTEAMEAAQAAQMQQPAQPAAPIPMPAPVLPPPPPGPPPVFGQQIPLPPPPPFSAAAGSGMSSPLGTQVYGTETDVSNYDSNRKRRRAERAQAKQARSGGSRVEFS